MSRQLSKLSALFVKQTSKPGRYADGGGLYLQVSTAENKSWLFRFMLDGKARTMGLGSTSVVSLAEARIKALDCRKSLVEGNDPINTRRAARTQRRLDAAKSVIFDQCAASYIEAHRSGWKNAKHADQWANTIATYASPIIGKLPVQSIDTALVMRVLEPIWRDKTETANRLRSRIELVLGWATVRGYRTGDNPARWRGHLDKLLPKRSNVQKVEHYAALPGHEMGGFMAKLREADGIGARALEFLILTATRTSETLGAKWGEFDLQQKLWTIPAERMKAKREHRVPLSPAALNVIENMREVSQGEYVFSAGKNLLSNMAMLTVLRRMEVEVTAHGFRSTFRDWAAERTNFPRDVAEAALAHTIGDKVEAAYRRGDLFMKRQKLMSDWARFCAISNSATASTPLFSGESKRLPTTAVSGQP